MPGNFQRMSVAELKARKQAELRSIARTEAFVQKIERRIAFLQQQEEQTA